MSRKRLKSTRHTYNKTKKADFETERMEEAPGAVQARTAPLHSVCLFSHNYMSAGYILC